MTTKLHYIKMTEEMFQLLVAGKEVRIFLGGGEEVHLLLEDMGWDRMIKAIMTAQSYSKENQ